MQDLAYDIEVIEDVLIAFTEGASDEKRAALISLERLLAEKQDIFNEFEKTCPENEDFI